MNRAVVWVPKKDGGAEDEKVTVGKIYSVKLITGDEFNGIALAYDSDPNFLMFDLQEGTKPKPLDSKTLRMVNGDYVTDIKCLSLGRVKDPLAKNPSLNLDGLQTKETDAIRDVEKIGIGVTAEAQLIFDTMSETLQVRWNNKDILAMEEVFIRSPYQPDCVSGGPRLVCDRVKSVLKKVRRKLKLSET